MDLLNDKSQTSADMNSLRVLMLRMICEATDTRVLVEYWSAEIISICSPYLYNINCLVSSGPWILVFNLTG